jgi:hypothetical protein
MIANGIVTADRFTVTTAEPEVNALMRARTDAYPATLTRQMPVPVAVVTPGPDEVATNVPVGTTSIAAQCDPSTVASNVIVATNVPVTWIPTDPTVELSGAITQLAFVAVQLEAEAVSVPANVPAAADCANAGVTAATRASSAAKKNRKTVLVFAIFIVCSSLAYGFCSVLLNSSPAPEATTF